MTTQVDAANEEPIYEPASDDDPLYSEQRYWGSRTRTRDALLAEMTPFEMQRKRKEVDEGDLVQQQSRRRIVLALPRDLCYCHICKHEVLCEPADLPDDKDGPIQFVPKPVYSPSSPTYSPTSPHYYGADEE